MTRSHRDAKKTVPTGDQPEDQYLLGLVANSLDNLADLVFILNADLLCVAQYGGLFNELNFPVPRFVGMHAQEVFPPELAKTQNENARQALRGEIVEYAWNYHFNGSTYYIHTMLSPIKSDDGEVTGVIGIARDMSELYLARQEAEDRKAELDQIFDQSPTAMMLLGKDGRPIRLNKTHETLWNVRLEDHTHFNLLDDEQLTKLGIREGIKRAFAGEEVKFPPLFYDARWLNPNANAIWIRSILSPVRNASGEVRNIILITEDITREYQAQTALVESEARFRSLFESSPDVLVVLNNRVIEDINPASEKAFGYKREEVVGQEARLVYFSDESFEQFGRILYSELERDGSSSMVWTFKAKDGTPLMMDTRGVELANGRILTILRDVSEQQEAQRKLQESEERFRQVFEHFPQLLALLDGDKVLDVNPAGCQKFGFNRNEIQGKSLSDFFPIPAEEEAFREKLSRGMQDDFRNSFTYTFRLPDRDEEVILEISVSLMPDELTLLAATDITKSRRSQEALQESEELFRGMFEHMTEIVAIHEIVFDEAGEPSDYRILDVNPAYERFIGLKRDDVVGKLATEAYGVSEVPYLDKYAKIAMGGGSDHFDTFYEPLNKHFSISVTRTGVNRFATISWDITSEVTSTELLLERERLLSQAQAIGKLGNWNFLLKPVERMEWSKQMFEIYGIDPEDGPPTAEGVFKFIHPEDLEEYKKNLLKQRDRKASEYKFEYRLLTKQGELKHVRHIGTPIFREGEIHSVFGTLQDITNEVKSIELLRESEAELREAQEITKLGSWSSNLRGGDANVSEEFLRIFEIERDESKLTHDFFLNLVHPEDRERARKHFIEQRLKPGKKYTIDYRILFPDGRIKHLHHVMKVTPGVHGAASRVSGTVQDVTERAQAAEQQRKLESQMLHTQKLESLGVLAGGIAHDFNNILMTILGNADLALSELPDYSPARQNLDDILSAAKHAAELTKQMLAYSGKGHFQSIPLDLGQLVQEMTNILEVSVSKKTTLQKEFEPELPAVRMDAGQMRQVVMNLILNASEAIDEAESVIKIRTGVNDYTSEQLNSGYIEEELPAGRYVFLEVQDTGSGMDEETLTRLFDPFFTTKFTGRGLGLASVLGIVRGHRGTIHVSSTLGKGSTFTVLLPAVDEPAHNLPRQTPDSKPWSGSGTLLIVDDEPTVLKVGKMMLNRFGFEVETARDGRDAIDLIQQNPSKYSAIILDMTMPRLDGPGVISELNRLQIKVPVILSSGYNSTEIAGRFSDGTVSAFIQKPYQLNSLRDTIRKVLADSQ